MKSYVIMESRREYGFEYQPVSVHIDHFAALEEMHELEDVIQRMISRFDTVQSVYEEWRMSNPQPKFQRLKDPRQQRGGDWGNMDPVDDDEVQAYEFKKMVADSVYEQETEKWTNDWYARYCQIFDDVPDLGAPYAADHPEVSVSDHFIPECTYTLHQAPLYGVRKIDNTGR